MPAERCVSEDATSVAFRTTSGFDLACRAAAWTSELVGWRRYGLAFLLGVLAAGALPPLDVVPLLLPAFMGLVWLFDGTATKRGAFALGWSFGFGYFVAGLYWIAVALLVDVARFWWLMPFAVMGLPAIFGIYTGLALTLCRAIGARGPSRILLLALAWTGAEWVRGHAFTGFPWNLLGYVWSGGFPGGLDVLQSTALVGIYGLTLLTVALAAWPALLADPAVARRPGLRRWAPLVVSLAGVVLLMGGGALRLADAQVATVPGVLLRLVQPSIAQNLKWDPGERVANFERHLALSAIRRGTPPTHIIWPEAAATFLLAREPAAREAIARIVPENGLLLTGAPRSDKPPAPAEHYWNSLEAIDGKGDIVASFDKFHLVPFGEYMPLKSVLPLKKITAGTVDFTPGPGPRTLDLPGLPPVGPLICYEVIFPGAVTDPAHRPDWLLNVTNDAWYGFTSGPFQHFAIARVRAVEEGLPLVRAANNGISGVFDAYGRIEGRLSLDAVNVIDLKLPKPLPATLYARFHDWTALALAGLFALGAAVRRLC